MRRAAPFLLVFGAGIALGYVLAERGGTPPEPPAPELAESDVDEQVPLGLAHEDVPPPSPVLEGRPSGRTAPPDAPARTPAPRVAKDGRVEVVVKLVLPGGGAPDGGRVYWSSEPDAALRSMRRMAWKPPHTSAFIQPGTVWLLATGGTHHSLESERVQVHVSARNPLQEARLALEERPGIRGRVVLPAEFDRPRLRVLLAHYSVDAPRNERGFDAAPPITPRASEGHGFAFRDLRPGRYLLGLSLGGRDVVLIEDVQVDGAMVEQDLVIEAFDPKRFMEVHVLGPKGEPLRDAQLSVTFSGEGRSISGGNVSLRRADGVFIVNHLPGHTRREDGSYRDGVFALRVHTQEHGEIVKPYDPASTPSLTVRVGELEQLVVRFDRYDPAAVPSHVMLAVRAVGETGVRNPRSVGPDGSVHFGERQPGAYEVVVMAGQPRPTPVAVHPFEFAPGDGVKAVPIPVLHRLVLRLPKDAAEPEFRLSRTFGKVQWSYGWARAGEPGERVWENLSEGTYTLEGHVGTRWVKREVRVPAESVVRLD